MLYLLAKQMVHDRRFGDKWVHGMATGLADGVSRWDRPIFAPILYALHFKIDCAERNMGKTWADLGTEILNSSTSVSPLCAQLSAGKNLVACRGVRFAC